MEPNLTPIGIKSTCPFCGKENPLVMTTRDEYMKYQRKELRAIELTHGNIDQAEHLISGTCAPCWDRVFTPDDDDDSIRYVDLGELGK